MKASFLLMALTCTTFLSYGHPPADTPRLTLLRAPLFDRIILASHSLGTVVAYDLLRLMWVEYSETFDNTRPFIPNQALTTMEQAGSNIPAGFRDLQYECWENQRLVGNKWLITDFVTMGSPLTYFDYLIVGSAPEFLQRVAEREYPAGPTCSFPATSSGGRCNPNWVRASQMLRSRRPMPASNLYIPLVTRTIGIPRPAG